MCCTWSGDEELSVATPCIATEGQQEAIIMKAVDDQELERRARSRQSSHLIKSREFMEALTRLKDLRSIFLDEGIELKPGELALLTLGDLNLLQLDEKSPEARDPKEAEWIHLESVTQLLFRRLTEPVRRKFILGHIPRWIPVAPVFLGLAAATALIFAVRIYLSYDSPNKVPSALVLPFYLVWLVSLGATGAIAFLGMNILSVQKDITFDLGNRRLIGLRIVLGALFGLVLTLPFGFGGFRIFVERLAVDSSYSDAPRNVSEPLLLLLPFLLGFSTSLVITILNRMIVGVQSIFAVSKDSDSSISDSGLSNPREGNAWQSRHRFARVEHGARAARSEAAERERQAFPDVAVLTKPVAQHHAPRHRHK
jgi:hypothetical protein